MSTNNIELIPASELPVAEGTEVDVLCVENGELKRKEGASLGGGEKADLVIALSCPNNLTTPSAENTTVTIESGSLDAVAEALREGRPPVVKCKRFYITNGFDTSFPIVEGGVYDCDVLYYAGNITFSFALPKDCMARIIMNIDDAEYLEVWFHPLVMSGFQVI